MIPDTDTHILVAGGGASGLCAAIHAARAGGRVTVLERGHVPCRKLAVTGNGRCNLAHIDTAPPDYNESARDRLSFFLERFDTEAVVSFFHSIGVVIADEDGYLYPLSGQAQSVVAALISECERLGVRIVCDTQVRAIERLSGNDEKGERFQIKTGDGGTYHAGAVILAGGGLSGGKELGATGDLYYICERLGLDLNDRYPALVGIRTEGSLLPEDGGIRVWAGVAFLAGPEGRRLANEEGELQLTRDGLSGIPALQASGSVVRALASGSDVTAVIDLFPGVSKEGFGSLRERLLSHSAGVSVLELLSGCINGRLASMLLNRMGIAPDTAADSMDRGILGDILSGLRHVELKVIGTQGYGRAQATAGGVALEALDDDLMARDIPGIYCTGELVDVDGRCGGYNLQWAWISGAIAGSAAAGAPIEGGGARSMPTAIPDMLPRGRRRQ